MPETMPPPHFSLDAKPAQRTMRFADANPVDLAERHRPRRLADLLGQDAAAAQLTSFAAAPYTAAFMFEGPTGTGKTSAALALANELGALEWGGLARIKSGAMDAESVDKALDALRFTPMFQDSPWHVLVCDEADMMSPKASGLWLSALEDLPGLSVVIFTTNHPGKFQARFRDRCERVKFHADPARLDRAAQEVIDRIWRAETGDSYGSPRVADLPGIVEDGELSLRRAVKALEPILRGVPRVARVEARRPGGRWRYVTEAGSLTGDRAAAKALPADRVADAIRGLATANPGLEFRAA